MRQCIFAVILEIWNEWWEWFELNINQICVNKLSLWLIRQWSNNWTAIMSHNKWWLPHNCVTMTAPWQQLLCPPCPPLVSCPFCIWLLMWDQFVAVVWQLYSICPFFVLYNWWCLWVLAVVCLLLRAPIWHLSTGTHTKVLGRTTDDETSQIYQSYHSNWILNYCFYFLATTQTSEGFK